MGPAPSKSHIWLVVGAVVGGALLLLIAFSIAFVLPAVFQTRDAQRREQLQENLRQIGLALRQNHSQHHSSGIRIRLSRSSTNDEQDHIEVIGLNNESLTALAETDFDEEQWRRLFAVFVAVEKDSDTTDQDSNLPAMLGDYRLEGETLVFEPRYPLRPGLTYRAVFDPEKLPGAVFSEELVSQEFSLPALPPSPPAVVTRVYPSRNTLPENQLKFYIHFSAPMSRGEAYGRVHLLMEPDSKSPALKEVELPFLELGEELWDHSGMRFTLFFDPGRIKRGLKPREEIGPSIEQGKSYTLLIDRAWLDASGQPLKGPFRKRFQVVGPDETQPDPTRWKLDVPSAGTTQPFRVAFAEPLDHAMLERVLVVFDSDGKLVAGTVEVDEEETRWWFRPGRAWKAEDYSLQVETTLEDLAGNSIAKPFEVDVFRPIQRRITTKTVSLPFEIRAAKSASP